MLLIYWQVWHAVRCHVFESSTDWKVSRNTRGRDTEGNCLIQLSSLLLACFSQTAVPGVRQEMKRNELSCSNVDMYTLYLNNRLFCPDMETSFKDAVDWHMFFSYSIIVILKSNIYTELYGIVLFNSTYIDCVGRVRHVWDLLRQMSVNLQSGEPWKKTHYLELDVCLIHGVIFSKMGSVYLTCMAILECVVVHEKKGRVKWFVFICRL